MFVCDHSFYSTSYVLIPEYHPDKVRPHLNVEFCNQCGVLRVGHEEKEQLWAQYLTPSST